MRLFPKNLNDLPTLLPPAAVWDSLEDSQKNSITSHLPFVYQGHMLASYPKTILFYVLKADFVKLA